MQIRVNFSFVLITVGDPRGIICKRFYEMIENRLSNIILSETKGFSNCVREV